MRVDASDEAGWCHDGCAVLDHGFDAAAAAFAAVADGVEAVEECVFEPSGVEVAAVVFVAEEL